MDYPTFLPPDGAHHHRVHWADQNDPATSPGEFMISSLTATMQGLGLIKMSDITRDTAERAAKMADEIGCKIRGSPTQRGAAREDPERAREREENTMLRTQLRSQAERHQKDRDILLEQAHFESRQLQEALAAKEREIQNLQNRAPGYQANVGGQELARLQHEIKQKDMDLRAAKAEAQELHTIIQSSAHTAEPLDAEIAGDFRGVCHDIRLLVRKAFRNIDEDVLSRIPTEEWVHRVYAKSNAGEKVRARLSEAMFNIFTATHIDKPVFSVGSAESNVLGSIEGQLNTTGQVTKQDAAEWRRRTVACLASLRNGTTYQEACENLLLRVLAPILAQKDTSEVSELKNSVRDLCEIMHAWAVRARQCRSTFSIDIPVRGRVLKSEREEEQSLIVEDVLGPTDVLQGARIHRIVFGGLAKTHWQEDVKVLLVKPVVIAAREN